MDESPLQKWQDGCGMNDFEVAGSAGLKRDRWLALKGGFLPTKEETEKLRALTGIPDIGEQCTQYARSRVPKAPPVVPPKQT